MNLEQAKNILSKEVKLIIDQNGPMKYFNFLFALTELFRTKPDALKASEVIEQEIGEESANKWLCRIMGETVAYSTDGEYVQVN